MKSKNWCWAVFKLSEYAHHVGPDLDWMYNASSMREVSIRAKHPGPGKEDPALVIVELLFSFARLRTTVPVDKVFALLAIGNDVRVTNHNFLFRPDYGKPTGEILIEFTRAIIVDHASLNPLRFVTAFAREVIDLPTWMPYWTSAISFPARPLDPFDEASSYRASECCLSDIDIGVAEIAFTTADLSINSRIDIVPRTT